MRLSDYLKELNTYVVYYPQIARMLGGVKEAVFLLNIFAWYKDKEIYKSCEQIEYETGLSYREQSGARKRLKELGVLLERHARLEHTIYYSINLDKFNSMWDKYRITCNSPTDKSAIGEMTKVQLVERQNVSPIYTDTTTDNTTEKHIYTSHCSNNNQIEEKKKNGNQKTLELDQEFEKCWTEYPKRHGSASKVSAREKFVARILNDHELPATLLQATINYRKFCEYERIVNTPYVMMPEKFYGTHKYYENYIKEQKEDTLLDRVLARRKAEAEEQELSNKENIVNDSK
jgi:hypothetical protein